MVQRKCAIWACVAVVALTLSAACTKNPQPRDTPPSSSSTSTASATPSPLSSADREAADRAAVENAWRDFGAVYNTVLTPEHDPHEWPGLVRDVAVDPVYSQVLVEADRARKVGIVHFGEAISHPYWTQPIAGGSTAVMGDCMDSSKSGTLWAKTGQKRSVGAANNNTRVTLVRGSDGNWRVKLIEYLVKQKC